MQAVMPEPQEETTVPPLGAASASSGTLAASMRARSSSGGRSVQGAPWDRRSVKGTFKLPGMWPPRMPGRGSGAVPSKRPGPRASSTKASCTSMLARTRSTSQQRCGASCQVDGGASVSNFGGGPCSKGKPSFSHRGRPPSSTATSAGWPKATFRVYHKRGAENSPKRSYTTTRVARLIPSDAMALAKVASSGSMCGTPPGCGEATASTSKKRAPGIRGPSTCSASAPGEPAGAANGELGRYQVASTTRNAGASGPESTVCSHSQETRPRSMPGSDDAAADEASASRLLVAGHTTEVRGRLPIWCVNEEVARGLTALFEPSPAAASATPPEVKVAVRRQRRHIAGGRASVESRKGP
mmetsp:Transcript_23194/g.65510  ORF Transcript_23194/g.65510 Transcript_23194/m.65510 type:complete len:356 (+) Transcript_23194:277-1344(+)